MAEKTYSREECLLLLQNRQKKLREDGEDRLPLKADFSNEEVVAIKAFWGPWPRALEAAGLKEERAEDRKQKNQLKRERARKRQKLARKAEKALKKAEEDGCGAEDPEAKLRELTAAVKGADREAEKLAADRQARLAKPPGSRSRLESLSVRLAGISGRIFNRPERKMLLVFCADNGVFEEGVSVSPQEITRIQAENLAAGKTGAGVLARAAGCDVRVYDVGINGTAADERIAVRKLRPGTGNIRKGPAMTREEAARMILTGADAAAEAVRDGADIIGIGELGIGNTATSSAVLAGLTGASPEEVTGRGGGLTDEALERKIRVIREAIALNRPDKTDALDVLAKLGGFDLAAMTGAFLGCAEKRVPAVIDGFISAVAALLAVRLCPDARDYLIPSHQSCEKGYRIAAKELGLEPLFDLQMRLGEGSGCPIAMKIVDFACCVMNGMASFEEAGIDDAYLDEIREPDKAGKKGGTA